MTTELLRSFLAIDLHSPMQARLDKLISTLKLRGNLAVRWVPARNIHLTLKFLGESELSRLHQLEKEIRPRLQAYEPFDIQVGGLGAFPGSGLPRVIWVGVQAPPALEKLAVEIESLAASLGFARENRRFMPHLTLGRVSQSASVLQGQEIRLLLQKTQGSELGSVRVEAVSLMKSVLSPGGAIYSPLSVMPFLC